MRELIENEDFEDMVQLHQSSPTSNSSVKRQPQRVAKKIPRNAPCPCGSGKKYKHCCGKSGPKKGLLAQD